MSALFSEDIFFSLPWLLNLGWHCFQLKWDCWTHLMTIHSKQEMPLLLSSPLCQTNNGRPEEASVLYCLLRLSYISLHGVLYCLLRLRPVCATDCCVLVVIHKYKYKYKYPNTEVTRRSPVCYTVSSAYGLYVCATDNEKCVSDWFNMLCNA